MPKYGGGVGCSTLLSNNQAMYVLAWKTQRQSDEEYEGGTGLHFSGMKLQKEVKVWYILEGDRPITQIHNYIVTPQNSLSFFFYPYFSSVI